jgi:Tol biopolymer transport system component
MLTIEVLSRQTKFFENFLFLLLIFVILLTRFEGVSAQTEIEAKITKGAVKYIEALDIAVIDFSPEGSDYAPRITRVVRDDLDYSLYFRVAEIDSFVLAVLGDDLYDMDGWYQLGVQYLLEGSIEVDEDKLKAKINVADVIRKKVIKSFKFESRPSSPGRRESFPPR